jgi:hypothetical protein
MDKCRAGKYNRGSEDHDDAKDSYDGDEGSSTHTSIVLVIAAG